MKVRVSNDAFLGKAEAEVVSTITTWDDLTSTWNSYTNEWDFWLPVSQGSNMKVSIIREADQRVKVSI